MSESAAQRRRGRREVRVLYYMERDIDRQVREQKANFAEAYGIRYRLKPTRYGVIDQVNGLPFGYVTDVSTMYGTKWLAEAAVSHSSSSVTSIDGEFSSRAKAVKAVLKARYAGHV